MSWKHSEDQKIYKGASWQPFYFDCVIPLWHLDFLWRLLLLPFMVLYVILQHGSWIDYKRTIAYAINSLQGMQYLKNKNI